VLRTSLAACLLLTVGLAGCASTRSPAQDLEDLAEWMTGTFDSSQQAAADPEAYHPIRLVMLPIWEDRTDGRWLYVEQAVAGSEERPYRQRVYHLTVTSHGNLRSDVFELPEDPHGFVAAWERPGVWMTCEPADLLPREGCAIHLRRRADGSFGGETQGTGCTSRLAGAEYATSEVVVTGDLLLSWDRGWSATHQQVWGAEKEPYEFRKVSSRAPSR